MPARLQLALEFFFGERALELGELVFDFAIAGFQVELLGALQKDLVVDELLDDIELQRERIFLSGLLAFGVYLRAIVLLDFVALDFRAIDDGPDIFRVMLGLFAA